MFEETEVNPDQVVNIIDELLYEKVAQSIEIRKDGPLARTVVIKCYRPLGLDFEIRAVAADDGGNSLRSVEFTSNVIGGRNPQTHHSATYDGSAPGNRITSSTFETGTGVNSTRA